MEADMANEMEVAEPENAQQEDLDQATKEELGVTEEEAQKIDLNTATVDELKAIPGIRQAVAKRIIEGVTSDFDCRVFIMRTSTTFCFLER